MHEIDRIGVQGFSCDRFRYLFEATELSLHVCLGPSRSKGIKPKPDQGVRNLKLKAIE
jgi:hypothetical protein